VTIYSYSVINDFPNQAVDIEKMEVEIAASSITTPYVSSTVHDATCNIEFESILSGPEETTLDGIVAGHTGLPYDILDPIYVESLSESETTSNDWIDKLTLDITGDPTPGTYRLDWTFKFGSAPANREIEARLYDTTANMVIENIIHQQPGSDVKPIYTGFCRCDLDGPKTIILQYRVNDTGGSPTAYISKARLLFGG